MPLRKVRERIKKAAAAARPERPAPPTFNRAYFDQKLEDLELSHREAAARLGFGTDHTKLTRTLTGHRRMGFEEAAQWAALFRVPVTEIYEQTGVPLDGSAVGRDTVPILGWVDAAGMVHTERPATGPRVVASPSDSVQGGAALRCRVPGSPLDRWLAFYRPSASIAHGAINRLCVIQTAEGTWLARVLSYGYDAGSWNLLPFCGLGEAVENVRVKSASPVLYFKTA
jgi:hypothetical protein